ncbi:uncharacterized protein DFL_008789 [Arthrobotrys flagrans]|uniref:Frequency clock protein n=1 Tax=Arthrobotrys flagrans TaxID=97331 RepID=A0A436ZPU2_ARTFL|nr:hypothetical protein DFL_008789 [Arthrobotrys flagrans]
MLHNNLMPVGNKSPKSSPTNSQKRRNHRKFSPVSLRHGVASASAAKPNRPFAIPPTLPHGSPARRKRSSKHKRHAARRLQQSHDQGIEVVAVEEEPHQPLTNEVDRESVLNSSTSGSDDRSVLEDWFKNLNTNVGDFNKPTIADGDSPYYLPSERQRKQRHQLNPNSRAAAAGGGILLRNRSTNLSRLPPFPNPSYPPMPPTQDSEDVYRSVIDDLTIKNKKLKKKLRKMERLHCNELNEEKLFEVRCYGLPPSRKQELQELLQNFAAGMDGNGKVYETKRSDAISNANAATSTNPSSSPLLQNTDSAYATETRMTSSDGVLGDATKGNTLNVDQAKARPKNAPGLSLHPETRSIQFTSEGARMNMVVKRLEQLFTGSDALQSELEKSQFQQQLAVTAATEKHDTAVDEVPAESGDEDDRREAAMMSHQQDDDLTKEKNRDQKSMFDTYHQRPTRPMDLDPNRAQVAADNLEYLEHLSFSSSHKNHRPASAGDTTGWVYLNLINNMAQIHTLHVSLPFIKKSIRAMSDKLELSPDGNKIRWRGGLAGTKLSSEGDSSSGMGDSSSGELSPGEGSSGLKSKTPPSSEDKSGINAVSAKDVKSRLSQISSPAPTPSAYNIDAFRYRPLMFHTLSTQKSNSTDHSEQDGSESSSEADTNNSGGPAPILESGICDIVKFAPIDGAIIYFGGAPFCTDLSAQVVFRGGGHAFVRSGDGKNYDRFVEEPVGSPAPTPSGDDDDTESQDRRPLSKFDWSAQDVEMSLTEDSEESLPGLTSIISPTTADRLPTPIPSPRPFEISGIGGVRSEDNFVTYVKTIQKPVSLRKSRFRKNGLIRHFIPPETLNQFLKDDSSTSVAGFETEITNAAHIQLQPSKLPDPVFAFYLSEDSSDPFASTPDDPQSHFSFAYNVECDSRSSSEGIPSFYSPDIGDHSPMDLDAEEGVDIYGNPLAPLSVVATVGSGDGGLADSTQDNHILKSLDDMDIGPI